MHRQYLHTDSRTIAYYDSDPKDKTANVLVLAHAFPLAASMWDAQAKAIPTGWRLLTIDLRGFGGSTIADDDADNASMDDYAADVLTLLSELGIRSAVVGGLSMGGYVTMAVLRAAPQVVRALVLADTREGVDSSEGRANRRSMLALLDREGPSGVARDMLPRLLGETTRESRPDVESNVRRLIKQQSPAAIRGAILRMMSRSDSGATLAAAKVPALVVVGEEDKLTTVDDSRRMASMLPDAELVIVPRAGHLSNLEQPAAFNDALSAFLARL